MLLLSVARFKNLDKLIHHANLDGRVNVFYSTPAAYTAAKHAYNVSWPLKTDDFFPYSDCPTCFWTGADLFAAAHVLIGKHVMQVAQYTLHVMQLPPQASAVPAPLHVKQGTMNVCMLAESDLRRAA